jgi:hypothetical protein
MELEFIKYCEQGKLTNVQQILENYPNINIKYDNERAFRTSCEYNHLEVAKWLWSLDQYIDIHVYNEYAFR